MNEDVKHGGKRRILIRRNNGGNTASDGNGTSRSDTGASTASTVSSGNEHDTNSTAELGNSSTGNGGSESEGMHSATGNEGERVRSNGSGGNGERSDDSGNFLTFGIDSGTDTDSSGSSDGRRNRGTQGQPKRTRRSKNSKTSVAVEQDTEDVKNIVIALGDAGSNATGFEGFKVSEPEALTIARPAARILQRHGAVAETIRTVADPLSLVIAAATVFGPRIALYKAYKDMGAIPQQRYVQQEEAPPQTTTETSFTDGVRRTDEKSVTRIDDSLFSAFQN